MRWPAILVPVLVFSCAQDPQADKPAGDPLVERIESEWRARLLDAADTPARDVVLHDDTPRINTPEDPGDETMLCYLRAASFHVPLGGLKHVTIAWDDRGLTLGLTYAEAEVVVLDATGAPATATALQALLAANANVGEATWTATVAATRAWAAQQTSGVDDLDARLDGYARDRVRWDRRFEKRFSKSLFALRRAALRARLPEGRELSDVYRASRLLAVKQALVDSVGGAAALATRPLAAGPVVGVVRSGDAEYHALLDGPDGMVVRVQIRGKLRADARARLLGSYRPYARGGRARHVADASRARTVLQALSRLHNGPTIERGAALIAALKLQGGTSLDALQILARSLAVWMKVDDAKLLAATAD
ncbi:MAG: hypothetical protein OER88_02970 [Planctomycetota bacterium]|nr:hypothetical protein [Planctomycetota bacterium]